MDEDKGASWVADARKVVQDFIAPEVRALTVRFDMSDKQAGDRHVSTLALISDRHAALIDMIRERDKVAAERHEALLSTLRERDAMAAERYNALLDKIESTRRELAAQIELAITKSKLEVLQASTSQAMQTPQQQ